MKLNSDIKILGKSVILVPYRHIHVPKYHEWMKSKELQKLTASEPLSLEQEYEMQKSWREDEDKCTFIILNKNKYGQDRDEINSMIGDTNIFIDKESSTGEIEIMIADQKSRGKKLGWESVILMLIFGIKEIKLKTYQAKISLDNVVSIKMFEKLDFKETSRSEVFGEITLEKAVSDEWLERLESQFEYEIHKH